MFRPLVLTFAVVALGSFTCGQARAEPKYHHLHHALYEMHEAHKELKEAKHDFGGHRDKAMEALHHAIKETEEALAAVGDPYKGFKPAKGIYDQYKSHKHLHHSVHEMREAHKQMKEAGHNFGGHKEKALHALDAAIRETEKCIQHIK